MIKRWWPVFFRYYLDNGDVKLTNYTFSAVDDFDAAEQLLSRANKEGKKVKEFFMLLSKAWTSVEDYERNKRFWNAFYK